MKRDATNLILKCNHCGGEHYVCVEKSGPHLKATCGQCGSYIKFLNAGEKMAYYQNLEVDEDYIDADDDAHGLKPPEKVAFYAKKLEAMEPLDVRVEKLHPVDGDLFVLYCDKRVPMEHRKAMADRLNELKRRLGVNIAFIVTSADDPLVRVIDSELKLTLRDYFETLTDYVKAVKDADSGAIMRLGDRLDIMKEKLEKLIEE